MKLLGLIPARGGSKGIPGKNIKPLAGKPLLEYTCEAALGAEVLDRVILSTDDEDIAVIGRECGVEVPFFRPQEHSEDNSLAIGVVHHVVDWLKENDGYVPDAIVYLQPTSPFRDAQDIKKAGEKFLSDKNATGLVSVRPVPHNFLPHKVMHEDGEYIKSQQTGKDASLNRQSNDVLYARNGPAILIVRTDILREEKLYGNKTLPYVMEGIEKNIDIDDPEDFAIAELLMKRRLGE